MIMLCVDGDVDAEDEWLRAAGKSHRFAGLRLTIQSPGMDWRSFVLKSSITHSQNKWVWLITSSTQ